MTGPEPPAPEPSTGPTPTPGERPPPERRLDAPPSSRYAGGISPADGGPATVDGAPATTDGASPARGAVFGVLVAAFVGLVMILLGSLLDLTAGLVVAAFFLGQLTAVGVRAGAGASLDQTRRAWIAVLIALGALVLAQLGLWAWAAAEGGVLGPLDYVREVFGALVAVEAVLAAVGAWWGSR